MEDIRDFKVEVVENIGIDSAKWFGKKGNVLNVVENRLIDNEGSIWSDLGVCSLFEKERRINESFGYDHENNQIAVCQTIFRVVYEDPKRESEELRAKIAELECKLNAIRSITEPLVREWDDKKSCGDGRVGTN